jgi:hypothetical protein
MRTLEARKILNGTGVGLDTSQQQIPVGNLLITGGLGQIGSAPRQGLGIWAHQAEPDTKGPRVGFHIPKAGQTSYHPGAPISMLIHETLQAETINSQNSAASKSAFLSLN